MQPHQRLPLLHMTTLPTDMPQMPTQAWQKIRPYNRRDKSVAQPYRHREITDHLRNYLPATNLAISIRLGRPIAVKMPPRREKRLWSSEWPTCQCVSMQRPAPKMPVQFLRWSEGHWSFEASRLDHIQDSSEPSGDVMVALSLSHVETERGSHWRTQYPKWRRQAQHNDAYRLINGRRAEPERCAGWPGGHRFSRSS